MITGRRVPAAIFLAGASMFLCAGPALGAAPTYDLTGPMSSGDENASGLRGPQSGSGQITFMDMTTGAFSGTTTISGTTFQISGTESGSSVAYTTSEGAYAASDSVPTLSIQADGKVGGDGSFSDNAGHMGYKFWVEFSPPGAGGAGAGSGAGGSGVGGSSSNPTGANTLPSATSLRCNRGPNPGDPFTCTAIVADASGRQPSQRPTGSVAFAAPNGGFGSPPGSTCVLAPGSPGVGFCVVSYAPSAVLSAGTAVPLTATYSGDGTFGPSSSAGAARGGVPATTTQLCGSAVCGGLTVNGTGTLGPGQTTQTLTGTCSTPTMLAVAAAPVTGQGACATTATTSANPADLSGLSTLTAAELQIVLAAAKNAASSSGTLTPSGTNALVLQQLTSMTHIQVQQHTGGNGDGFSMKTVRDITGALDSLSQDPSAQGLSQAIMQAFSAAFPSSSFRHGTARIALAASRSDLDVLGVLRSVTAASPTVTDGLAFDHAMALATSNSRGANRAPAELLLTVAARIGEQRLAGALRPGLRGRRRGPILIASAQARIIGGRTQVVTLAASPAGARILRVLGVVGLSHRETISLRLTVRRHGRSRAVTVSQRVA